MTYESQTPSGRKPKVPLEQIRRQAERGLTRQQIAETLGVSYDTVTSMCWRYKVEVTPDPRIKYDPDWFAQTCRTLTKKGWTKTKIARTFKVSRTTVSKYL